MGNENDYNDSKNAPSQYPKSNSNGQSYSNQQKPKQPQDEKKENDINTLCFPVSGLFGDEIAKSFGPIAEIYIQHELLPYLLENNISPYDLYLDKSVEGKSYEGFLIEHNKSNKNLLVDLGIKLTERRPDILIHNSDLCEYHEIKPNSPSGRSEGYSKVRRLIAIYSLYQLPYLPYPKGKTFVPPRKIEIGSTTITIAKVKVPITLSIGLEQEGPLIVYDLCITTNWAKILTSPEFIKALVETVLDLLKHAFEKIKELISDWVAENWGTLLGSAGLILILILTSEITIPAALLAGIVEYFSAAAFAAAAAAAR